MKRMFWLGAAAALLLAAPTATARTPLPVPKCAITGAKLYPAIGRLIAKGSCSYKVRQANGKVRKVVPYGQKWSYTSIKVYDFTGSACAVVQPAVQA